MGYKCIRLERVLHQVGLQPVSSHGLRHLGGFMTIQSFLKGKIHISRHPSTNMLAMDFHYLPAAEISFIQADRLSIISFLIA